MKVVWTVRALQDVEEIYRYVAADKPDAAARLAGRLLESGDQLEAHPYLGRAAQTEGIRELVVGKFLLLYRVRDELEILTVTHGARRRKRS